MKRYSLLALATMTALTVACDDDDPTEPRLDRAEVAGTYVMTELSFDPRGSLPAVDVLDRVEAQSPELRLTSGGLAQLNFTDPSSGLLRSADGTFATTISAVEITFQNGQPYATFLLSQQVLLDFNANEQTLIFDDEPTGGVQRDRLRDLVPEFEDEQLEDPVPGELRVVFQAPTEEQPE